MATLLLARPTKETKGKDLKRTLLHLLHGFQAIENALNSFLIPFSSHESLLATDGHAGILADFDAHVGDTACHMRAQMIWELYEYYKVPERRTWIDLALIALGQVKVQTVALIVALHLKNGYMRALGFGSVVTYGQIFDKIGWTSFLDALEKKWTLPVFNLKSRTGSFSSTTSSTSTRMPVTPDDMEPIQPLRKSDYYGLPPVNGTTMLRRVTSTESIDSLRSTLITRPIPMTRSTSGSSDAMSSTYCTPASSIWNPSPPATSTSSHSYRSVTADCTWDITNHLTIVRFLSLCRLLSVGKKAKVQAGFPNATIRARTDPEFIYIQTQKEIEAFYNSVVQQIPWNKLISEDDMMKKTSLVKEEEAVQVWLSNLTADWTISLAQDVGLSKSMQSLLRNSIAVSPRQIACVASYPSIIPIRAEWMMRGTPILMVIRRFCSQGYHSSFYRVTPNTSAWGAQPPIKNARAVDFGNSSWFSIQRVTSDEVCSASWATTPHFVLIANSIDGTNGEFYDRVAAEGFGESGSTLPHECDNCAEHQEYLPRALRSNFARIIMGFFGQHDQYPFELMSSTNDGVELDGYEYVADRMAEEGFGKKAMESYWRSIREVEESGTGDCPWMYTLEHAYTELPFVVGRHVREIIRKGIQPVPIGYRWW